jgi:hypothetical protein
MAPPAATQAAKAEPQSVSPQVPSPRKQLLVADPVADFKAYVPAFLSHTHPINSSEVLPTPTVEIDVRKTESLVSPFLGILKLTYKYPNSVVWVHTLTFAAQEDQWIYRGRVGRIRFNGVEKGEDDPAHWDAIFQRAADATTRE